jgi:FkbM family methyltransferase
LIVDYEAGLANYEAKKKLEADKTPWPGRIELHNEAVSDFDGVSKLQLYRGGQQGDTICSQWQQHVVEKEYFDGSREVRVVTMASVLRRFNRVRELWLNCEGSEIPILMGTPVELLTRCQYISVEFHRFSSFLNITNGDVIACVHKLSEKFDAKCVEDYHPYYEFFRKP